MDMTKFTAGFARLDITPPLGVPLAGSWNARCAMGVHDPLEVNAIAFGDGERDAVLLVVDLCGLYGENAAKWPHQLAEELQLERESLIICCTHTHTGPAINRDAQYDAWLYRRLKDAATCALRDRKPVSDVKWAQGNAEGLTFTRRWILSDGTVMTNPAGAYQQMIVAPAGVADTSLRVIQIQRQEAEQILIGNFQSHPDNIGGEMVSTDYPGVFRRQMEKSLPNSKCVFLDGAEGQMVISDRRQPKTPASFQKAYDHGTKLAGVALALLENAVSTQKTGLTYGQKAVRLKTKRDSSRVPFAEKVLELHAQDRDLEFAPNQKQANYILSESRRIVALEKNNEDYRDAVVSAIAFCGLALVGLPVEPFCELGMQIRDNSKFPVTCVMCQANGWHGYLPTAEAHDQGGYEAYNTPYVKGTGEQMADAADALVATL